MLSFCRKHPVALTASLLALLLSVMLLRAAILKYQYYFGMYHDDGVYLVSAESLARGLGYRILSLPGEPFQTKYPVGYPLLLASFLKVFPDFPANLVGLEIVQASLSVLSILITAAYLIETKKVTPSLGLVIAAAVLLNMRFIDFAPMLMSDLVAALLVGACLWCAEVQARKPDNYAPWTALLMAGAASVRSQSIVLIPTLLTYYLVKRRFKSIIPVILATTLLIAPQIWWQLSNSKSSPEILSFYTNYLKHAYGTLPDAASGISTGIANFQWATILQINAYLPGLEQIDYTHQAPLVFFLLYNVVYYILAIPSLTGMFVLLRRVALPALFCFFYGMSFSIWPIKLEWRHILPVMVFGYHFYFVGFRFWFRKVKNFGIAPGTVQLHKVGVTASVLFAVYIIGGAGVLSCAKAGWGSMLGAPTIPATFADFAESAEWVKSNTPANSVFVCNNDPLFYLYTKRHAIMPSRMELWRFVSDKYADAASLSRAIEFSHADYVVNEPVFRSAGFAYVQLEEAIAELQNKHPGQFLRVFSSSNGLVNIYRIEAAP